MFDRKLLDQPHGPNERNDDRNAGASLNGQLSLGHGFDSPSPLGIALSESSSSGREPRSTGNDTGRNGLADVLGIRIREQIGDELLAVEALLESTLASRYREVQELANRAAAMGGKRLRPMLVLLFAQAARGEGKTLSSRELSDARRSAVAVELVHAASLVHDDVMDEAIQRRHQPTISHACGNRQAVLLGDYLFTRAYAVAASCSRATVARRIADAATQLCEGELRQQASAGNWRLRNKEYRSILNQKTGALTGVSCRLGCSVVGSSPARQKAAEKFGELLGLAFQIFDDWLDYWGEGERVGKTLGTDLGQLKPTLPLMRLMRTSSTKARRGWIELLESNDPSAFAKIRSGLDRSDACSFTLDAARRCVARAKLQLAPFADSHALECIQAIADFSVQRKY